MIDLRAAGIIAREELVLSVRNRWTVLIAALFGTLSLAIAYFGMVTAGAVGFQGFARTSASLLNLVLYLYPLLALVAGAQSFAGDPGTTELLFAQPVSRATILLGKLAGLFASMAASTGIGFGLAGLVIAANADGDRALRYCAFVGLALVLALVFLGLSALVASVFRKGPRALGAALFVWFFFVGFYDLLVIGGSFLVRERTANTLLFVSLFGNPVDMVRTASLMALDGREVFGPAGAALVRYFGGIHAALIWLLGALGLWIVVPLVLSRRVLERQDF